MDKDDIYRRHILDAIEKIDRYVTAVSFDKFLEDSLLQDAVIRELQIIGEASKKLSEDFKNKITTVRWKEITGSRDILIHDYFDVDLEIVWKTIKEDLISLRQALSSSR